MNHDSDSTLTAAGNIAKFSLQLYAHLRQPRREPFVEVLRPYSTPCCRTTKIKLLTS